AGADAPCRPDRWPQAAERFSAGVPQQQIPPGAAWTRAGPAQCRRPRPDRSRRLPVGLRRNVMKNHLRLVVLPLTLGLAACAAEYSKSEAPDTLRVDGADSRRELAFAAGSAYLTPSELRKIDGWA